MNTIEMIRSAVEREQDRKNLEAVAAVTREEVKVNEAFLKDTDKPSLERLSYVLRHKELWPEGFQWDFSVCVQCAMGMARDLWWKGETAGLTEISYKFDLAYPDSKSMFLAPANKWYGKSMRAVTPNMVADRIDAYLANPTPRFRY
jgi:hypothetical protein